MESRVWQYVLMLLALSPPLVVLLILILAGAVSERVWIWLLLLIGIWMIWSLMTLRVETAASQAEELRRRSLDDDEQPGFIQNVMDVRTAIEEEGVQSYWGTLRTSPHEVYQALKQNLPAQIIPVIREELQNETRITLVPISAERAVPQEEPVRWWLHGLLFGLTLLTTTWAGAWHQGVNLLQTPGQFVVGLPYSLGLLAILGLHELGHYFAALKHGMRVTPPYFIPVPFALGTFGAFIRMKSPPENRRALFDVAVAGPLAGLVVAVPALLIGLQTSTVIVDDNHAWRTILDGIPVGSSLLFALLSKAALGDAVATDQLLRLSPLAFAGWLGLIVTALNLLPIGQLDGGHMTRAMFGTRAGAIVGKATLALLFLIAVFVWPALLLWALLVFFLAGRTGTPPLDDLAPISSERSWIGWGTFLILAVIVVPLPGFFG